MMQGEELCSFYGHRHGKCKGVLAARRCLFRTVFTLPPRTDTEDPPAHQQKGPGGEGAPGFQGGMS